MERMRVGVIFGGRSVEHDVSIITAHQMMAVLADRHDVVPIYITREGRWLSSPNLNDLDIFKNKTWDEVGHEGHIPPVPGMGGLVMEHARVPLEPREKGVAKLTHAFWEKRDRGARVSGREIVPLDVVVPAVHGTFGEDGTIQGLLEMADIPYTGSGVVASSVGLDKVAMKTAFRGAGLPVVHDMVVDVERLHAQRDAVVADLENKIDYPMFVKPVTAGSSVGIAKATDRGSLIEALEVAASYDLRILVERSMEGCLEINCSVLGGVGFPPRASVCEQPVAWEDFLSFQDKYMRSGKGSTKAAEGMASQERRIPAPISDELTKQVQENALTAFRAIGASGVARIDSFVKEDTGETWVMEINTMPGSFAFYLWEESGMSFSELSDNLISIARATHAARSRLMFSFDSDLLARHRGGKTGA